MPERLLAPTRRRFGRWVGRILGLTLATLMCVALLGALRQGHLLRETTDLAAEPVAYRQAYVLLSTEYLLLQAVVTAPDDPELVQLDEVQPRVLDALRHLASLNADGHQAHMQGMVDSELRVQAGIKRILESVDRGEQQAALDQIEDLELLMNGIIASVLEEDEVHAAKQSAQLAGAERESAQLSFGMKLLFLFGLAFLTVTALLSRADRRIIERMVAEDALTGLPNRTAFQIRTKLALRDARSGSHQPTVLMLDLDGFKDVNDSLGHHAGDLLLVEVAHRLRASVRAQDTVARLGGDEFAFLIIDAEPGIGEDTADRITQALNHPFIVEEMTLDIEASVGIATAGPGDDAESLVRHADTAMYIAKEHNLVHTRFDPDQSHSAERLTLMGSMRQALDAGEFVLHYQPKISVDRDELVGAEALVRWQHPTRGLLPPSEFIPMVERTSLVHRFTAHVLARALAQARVWLDTGSRIPVAVNVSTRCLLDSQFAQTVAQSLLAAGVPGELLWIEITEDTIMADPERAIDSLRSIRALGVRTSIDDFGTGYSSMAYLRLLPVDEIKVDRSFVRDLGSDPKSRVLVESAVELGHNLGLSVIAEGVEDESALTELRKLGCDAAQGFYFARPMPAADFDAWVRSSPRHGRAVHTRGLTTLSQGATS